MEEQPNQNPEPTPEPAHEHDHKRMRTCPYCKQKYEIKSSWDALWRWPTLQEWLILFMMAMMVFAAWAYKHDVQVCRDFIANGTKYSYGVNVYGNHSDTITIPSNLNITNDVAAATPGSGSGNSSGNASDLTK